MTQIDLPVIDVSQFPKELEGVQCHDHPEVAKFREACKEWGFLRLVNHGIPADLLKKMLCVSRELMSVPKDVKERVQNYNPLKPDRNSESFFFLDMPNPIQEFSRNIWPEEGNSNFSETIGAYNSFLSDIAVKVTKFIIASLGLDSRAYYESDFERCIAVMFIARYASQGKPVGDVLLDSHVDAGCLSILYSDENEGLEVRSKEGNWVSVKHTPDSIIVNLGDAIKVWSNGRYRSTYHRVVYKGWPSRMILTYVTTFPLDAKIWAPQELVDQDNQRRYNATTVGDLLIEAQTKKADGDMAGI